MQPNAASSINVKNSIVDISAIAKLTTPLLEEPVIQLFHQNTAEPLQKELVSTCKATGLELTGIPKLLLLRSLVIQQAQTGIIAKQKAGFLGIPLLSTCKNQL